MLRLLQPGDVQGIFADADDLIRGYYYKPSSSLDHGIKNFAQWFVDYF